MIGNRSAAKIYKLQRYLSFGYCSGDVCSGEISAAFIAATYGAVCKLNQFDFIGKRMLKSAQDYNRVATFINNIVDRESLLEVSDYRRYCNIEAYSRLLESVGLMRCVKAEDIIFAIDITGLLFNNKTNFILYRGDTLDSCPISYYDGECYFFRRLCNVYPC